MFLKEALNMTKLVNTFKAAGAALAQGNATGGYKSKMARAVNFVEMFQQHGLSAKEIEEFSAAQQQQYND